MNQEEIKNFDGDINQHNLIVDLWIEENKVDDTAETNLKVCNYISRDEPSTRDIIQKNNHLILCQPHH